jgi:N-acetyl-alpha-D-glucosaminyl L-malate synthase BshA
LNIGITCYPTVGGSGAVAAELGKQLARRGHRVHFVSYRMPFRLDEFHENICFHEVDVSSYVLFEYPPHDLALAAKMAEAAREHALDLFHVHYAIPHALAGFLAQQMLGDKAPKLITTLHGTDITLVGQDRRSSNPCFGISAPTGSPPSRSSSAR